MMGLVWGFELMEFPMGWVMERLMALGLEPE